MKYYKDDQGKVFGYDSTEAKEASNPGLTPLSSEEINGVLNPPLTQEDHIANMSAAIQGHLDATAQSRKYDTILSLVSYAGSPTVKFNDEGTAGVVWRDAVWSYGEQVVADVLAGEREAPTAAELISELPIIEW